MGVKAEITEEGPSIALIPAKAVGMSLDCVTLDEGVVRLEWPSELSP